MCLSTFSHCGMWQSTSQPHLAVHWWAVNSTTPSTCECMLGACRCQAEAHTRSLNLHRVPRQIQRSAAQSKHTLGAPGVNRLPVVPCLPCRACLSCLPACPLACRPACSTNVGGAMSTGDNGFTVQLPAGVTLPPDAFLTPGTGSPPGKWVWLSAAFTLTNLVRQRHRHTLRLVASHCTACLCWA